MKMRWVAVGVVIGLPLWLAYPVVRSRIQGGPPVGAEPQTALASATAADDTAPAGMLTPAVPAVPAGSRPLDSEPEAGGLEAEAPVREQEQPAGVIPDAGGDAESAVAGTTGAARGELAAVKTLIRDYRLALGENPVGNNAEITRALGGANAKGAQFLAGGAFPVSDGGELVDGWGTPLFFHQISGQEMEIRSAGPDRRMWSEDDEQVR